MLTTEATLAGPVAVQPPTSAPSKTLRVLHVSSGNLMEGSKRAGRSGSFPALLPCHGTGVRPQF